MAKNEEDSEVTGTLSTEAEKLIKTLTKYDRELSDTMGNMNNDELKDCVLQSILNLNESERERGADDKLRKARAKYNELKGPYDDAKKFQSAKVKYGILLLEERGVSLEVPKKGK